MYHQGHRENIALASQQAMMALAAAFAFAFCTICRTAPAIVTPTSLPSHVLGSGSWVVTLQNNILQIAYGSGTNFPQYGALHLESSYFRLNYGPASGWGTSVILFPAFWSNGQYYQGAPVTKYEWQTVNQNLKLSIAGTIGGLDVASEIILSPPAESSIIAQVTTTVTGSVPLDNRPGEAFKPVMLSSMHISPTLWDTQRSFAGCWHFEIPVSGWIVLPPFITTNSFGLLGGTSDWKTNAPTIWIVLSRPMQVTGWVTQSTDPNDDNVGFWAAADEVTPRWNFSIIATSGTEIHCLFLPLVQKR